MSSAIYAGSFDPVTKGHLDIIKRASSVFENVTVLVASNPRKDYTFSVDERVRFIRQGIITLDLQPIKTVTVLPFKDGLIADYAYINGIKTIVKGVRGNQDFDYEKLLHEISISQQAGIDTHILFSREGLHHVSSSAAKDLCKFQGIITDYVTPEVKQALEVRLNEQWVIGVTGVIGAGKSYVSKELERIFEYHPCFNIQGGRKRAWNIELDHLAHEILFGDVDSVPFAFEKVRWAIRDEFKMSFWSRKHLGEIVFNDPAKLAFLNNIMANPMKTLVRSKMNGKKGLIILNGALLVESGYLDACNNNIVLLKASEEITRTRLKARGMNDEQINRRLASQLTFTDKKDKIESKMHKDAWGSLIIQESNKDVADGCIPTLVKSIQGMFGFSSF